MANLKDLLVNGNARVVGTLYANVTGSLVGNASTATNFAAVKNIALTGNVTGNANGGASGGWSIATTIANSAVVTAMIADGNVTTAKLDGSAVTTAKIADSNVTTAKIADLNVTEGKLAASAVTTGKIKDANVTTAKIADKNVTNAKLANSSLTIGTTTISLGGTSTTLAGLTSVTATSFVGNADSATKATQDGNGDTISSTYLKLEGGTLTGTLEIQGTSSVSSLLYSGGAYYNGVNNLLLRGDTTYGISGIAFTSSKGTTSINQPSDRAFIQFQPYGSTLAAEGSQPTLGTSGEANKLVIGVGNDADDMVYLQTPSATGLRHISGTTNSIILDSGNYNSYAPSLTGKSASGTWGISVSGNAATASKINTTAAIGGTTQPVYVASDGTVTAGTELADLAYIDKSGTTVSTQSQSTKFLREDGTWAAPSYTTNTNTWNANALNVAGYVAAGTTSTANKVWKCDASGNPAWRADADTDTKNTAGSTDTSSKIYLIGATSQAANPETYSDNQVFTTSGTLQANELSVAGSATWKWDSTSSCLNLVFA